MRVIVTEAFARAWARVGVSEEPSVSLAQMCRLAVDLRVHVGMTGEKRVHCPVTECACTYE